MMRIHHSGVLDLGPRCWAVRKFGRPRVLTTRARRRSRSRRRSFLISISICHLFLSYFPFVVVVVLRLVMLPHVFYNPSILWLQRTVVVFSSVSGGPKINRRGRKRWMATNNKRGMPRGKEREEKSCRNSSAWVFSCSIASITLDKVTTERGKKLRGTRGDLTSASSFC